MITFGPVPANPIATSVRPNLEVEVPRRRGRSPYRAEPGSIGFSPVTGDVVFRPHGSGTTGVDAGVSIPLAAISNVDPSTNPWIKTPASPPFVLDIDRDAVEAFNQVTTSVEYRVETRLLPEPYVGRPDAPIVLLLLNPGVGGDEFWLHQQQAFRDRVLRCLHHDPANYPNFYLDPMVKGDGAEFHKLMFKHLIAAFGPKGVANAILDLEYFPYHSRKFAHGRIHVPSQAYTLHLLRSAIKRDAVVLVGRGRAIWEAAVPELRDHKRVFQSRSRQNAVISPRNYPEGYSAIWAAARLC